MNDEHADEMDDSEQKAAGSERIRLTPGLVILGILAVILGIFAGVVMSARSLAP